MSKAIINALTIAAYEAGIVVNLGDAKAFAEQFVAENEELFSIPSGPQIIARALSTPPPPTPQRPPSRDDLSPAQIAALSDGRGLCPNCQQPTDDHLPGCARATGEDNKAITKNKLNPVA